MKSYLATAAVALALSSAHAVLAAEASAITGRWDAALVDNGPPVAFRLEMLAKTAAAESALRSALNDLVAVAESLRAGLPE